MSKKAKQKILKTLDKGDENDKLSRAFDAFIMALILLNVLAVIIETVDSIHTHYEQWFTYFEVFSVTIFSVEYLIRLWACTAIEKYSHPVWGRLKYMVSFEAIIDLFAILPFYLPFILNSGDGRMIRIFRLLRLLRIFKLGRYSLALSLVSNVIKNRKEELIVTLSLLIILLIFASTFMFYIENEANPEAFPNIPQTMWWGVATLTTVGYGDVYPITPLGKVLGAAIAVLGVGLFALPAGIIAAGFEGELGERKKKKKKKDE